MGQTHMRLIDFACMITDVDNSWFAKPKIANNLTYALTLFRRRQCYHRLFCTHSALNHVKQSSQNSSMLRVYLCPSTMIMISGLSDTNLWLLQQITITKEQRSKGFWKDYTTVYVHFNADCTKDRGAYNGTKRLRAIMANERGVRGMLPWGPVLWKGPGQ